MPKRAAVALLLVAFVFMASFSDMPPHQVTAHIVCWRVGGGFCWVPWVW